MVQKSIVNGERERTPTLRKNCSLEMLAKSIKLWISATFMAASHQASSVFSVRCWK